MIFKTFYLRLQDANYEKNQVDKIKEENFNRKISIFSKLTFLKSANIFISKRNLGTLKSAKSKNPY